MTNIASSMYVSPKFASLHQGLLQLLSFNEMSADKISILFVYFQVQIVIINNTHHKLQKNVSNKAFQQLLCTSSLRE